MASRCGLVVAVIALFVAPAWGYRIAPEERLTEHSLPKEWGAPPGALENGVPIVDPPTRIAGYFKLDNTKAGNMFYFYFQARRNAARAPVVLWMTGGPGCSSELAVLYENGPYTVDKTGTYLTETKFGWDVEHNMIFVDQPLGTGFSYTDDDADTVYGEDGVGEDMLDFLHNFFAAHPELADLPLYVTGESYAGHYVPATAHRVWLSNKNKEGPYINLQGLAIGNGLTEPATQFNAYGDFAQENGLISGLTRDWLSLWYPICNLANKACDATGWSFLCALGLQYCMVTQFQPILMANPDINVYDITKKCEGRLCYDFTAADKFLNRASTREALGVRQLEWQSCAPDVYMNFAGDWLRRFDKVLPEMMSDGVRVMIYAGDLDLICNWLGNRRWVDSLDWDGAFTWKTSDDEEWVVQGNPAGKVKEVGPLTFVRVYKAGHMVPMDQPLNGLAMISTWTRNMSLVESPHRHHGPNHPATRAALDAASARLLAHTSGEGSSAVAAASQPGVGGIKAPKFVRAVTGKVASIAQGMMERAQAAFVARKLRA